MDSLAIDTLFSFYRPAYTLQEIFHFIFEDPQIQANAPQDSPCFDPKTQLPLIYAPKRKNRPRSSQKFNCPICEGHLTTVVQLAPLQTSGYTFIQGNLFPIVAPLAPIPSISKLSTHGVHLVQWCSTSHHADLHNMPFSDIAILFREIQIMEKLFLGIRPFESLPHRYFSVIKNVGNAVGGSLEHGHLQLLCSSLEPLTLRQDRDFFEREGLSYVSALRQTSNPTLKITENTFFEAWVPPFLKRPLQIVLVPKDQTLSYFQDFNPEQLLSLGELLQLLLRAIHFEMQQQEKLVAYNVLFHNGEVGTFYIEILPYTQPLGGFEQLGLYVCQSYPEQDAEKYRRLIRSLE